MTSDLRPLSLGELLDRVFFLYRKNFVLFAGIAALPHLVLVAMQLAGIGLTRGKVFTGPIERLPWTLAVWAVSLGVTAAAHGATVIAVSHLHLGEAASISQSFAAIKGRIFYLALIMIGYWIGIGVGFVLLIVPGIILALMWALTIPVAVIEDTGLRDSVNRSAQLTKGHRGRVFVIGLLFLVLFYAVVMIWEVPVLAVIGVMARSHRIVGIPLWSQIALIAGTFISQSLVSPLMTIGLSLMYYDERVRKEAFDLQHMMSILDSAPPSIVPAIGT